DQREFFCVVPTEFSKATQRPQGMERTESRRPGSSRHLQRTAEVEKPLQPRPLYSKSNAAVSRPRAGRGFFVDQTKPSPCPNERQSRCRRNRGLRIGAQFQRCSI